MPKSQSRYMTAAANRHDYEYLSKGKVIPHGIYDLQANKGYVSIGNSSETADFVIDNLRWWWRPSHG
jgi:Rhodopirellula transposase DDE domain